MAELWSHFCFHFCENSLQDGSDNPTAELKSQCIPGKPPSWRSRAVFRDEEKHSWPGVKGELSAPERLISQVEAGDPDLAKSKDQSHSPGTLEDEVWLWASSEPSGTSRKNEVPDLGASLGIPAEWVSSVL